MSAPLLRGLRQPGPWFVLPAALILLGVYLGPMLFALKAHAEARGITLGQFAVAWVLNNATVSAVIAGPRNEAQLADYLQALEYRLTAEDEALVDSLVAPGHNSTPNYIDPAEPVTGRPLRS